MKNILLSLFAVFAASAHAGVEDGKPNTGLKTTVYKVCGKTLELEEARTPAERQVGLMHRESVPQGKGMLFIFDYAEPMSFWMKNVPFDIDIAFFDSQGKLLNTHTMSGTSPLIKDMALPLYKSEGAALYAVEVAPGFYSKLQLKNCKLNPLPKR
jgi:uncharacterized membrane protein (UPF0127 family)